jgi:phage repressor protein C with HTH and peptisase S24 domain
MTTAFQSNAFQNSGFQVDPVTGVIYAVDQNDSCDIVGTVTGGGEITVDTHDGFTKDEIKRYKKMQKRIAQAEAAKVQARRDKSLLRKQQIADLVNPKPVVQVNAPKVKSEAEVKIDKPSIDTKRLNATIINLQRQQQQLLKTVELRNQIAQAQAMLAIHEAQMAAERDDEEALLLLL